MCREYLEDQRSRAVPAALHSSPDWYRESAFFNGG